MTENQTQWAYLGAALVVLLVLSQTNPQLAGGVVLLIALYLAVVKLAPRGDLTLSQQPMGTSGTF